MLRVNLIRISWQFFVVWLILAAGNVLAGATCATDQCHPDFANGNVTVHPEEAACDDCHQGDLKAHIDDDGLMTVRGKTCPDCHDDAADYPFPHQAVIAGDCKACHDPHGDLEQQLLDPVFTAPYIDYDKNSYEQCFSCHNRDLLMFATTAFDTGFRDKERNLHFLHVKKDKRGRNCLFCHGAHGASQPKLLNETILYGAWNMPMTFTRTENGGTCAPGCHRPQGYDRTIDVIGRGNEETLVPGRE